MINDLNEIKKQLNNIGCGMCLAKWTQVTMHLHNGMTHSCHHPSPHKIPLEEIKRNPTALHNTSFKKEKRREMLNGKKPEECNYCWNVENTSNSFSDRIFKSYEPWSQPYLNEIAGLDWRANYNPKYVEVSFSNTCNFKCSYCSPMFSSKWMEEIERDGAYPTSTNVNDLTWTRETNQLPYKFVLKVKNIINQGNVNEFIIFTSVESWEEQAEYIRNGLDFGLFFENVEYILKELPKVTINVMATFNALSIFGYGKLIDKIFSLKEKYRNNERYWISAIQLDTSYLRWPQHLSVKILEDEQKEFILEYAKKAFYYATPEFNHNHFGFSDVEVQKIKRLYDYAISKDDFDIDKHRNDFVLFVDEHDKRRGTNFLETFPEFKNLYKNVKNRKG